jgi:hypothetical protein
LGRIYESGSRYVVAVLGKTYGSKRGTLFEANKYRDLLYRGQVIPIWSIEVPLRPSTNSGRKRVACHMTLRETYWYKRRLTGRPFPGNSMTEIRFMRGEQLGGRHTCSNMGAPSRSRRNTDYSACVSLVDRRHPAARLDDLPRGSAGNST